MTTDLPQHPASPSASVSVSCEFFPPQTDEGLQKLLAAREALSALAPEYFSVTYGAGGTTRERTFEAVHRIAATG
ncbi:MAG TPA: methylenetetrahydrofolate reductase, partial [Plasticicumulans sp.]|nr:methylenetetrahydrofolate reductase [Plasticicumulans sp.]